MIYRGHVKGGVIVLDTPADLPEGTIVDIRALEGPEAEEPLDPMYRMGELAVDAGPPDLATNIDHYLYGLPTVEDDER